jgi:hypothetical protein
MPALYRMPPLLGYDEEVAMLNLSRPNRKFLRPLAFLVGAVFLMLVAVVSGSAVTHAITLTVTNTSDSGPGSLRQAVANAAPGDTVNFDPRLSGQTITLTSGDIGIGGNLTITGPAGGVTVSGNNTARVFTINSGVTVNMSHLTISNGSVTTGGGGIYNVGTLTLTNVTVSGNNAANGGGIDNGGTVTLTTNSTVSGNSANAGGGIYNTGILNMTNSTVSGNNAANGGGIDNADGGSATLTNSTVSGNSTPGSGSGGGINNQTGGTLNLFNSIVANQVSGGDCTNSGIITSNGYNLDSNGSCNLTATGDLPNTNPMLGPLALNPPGSTETQALLAGSPAIDHIPVGVNGCGTTVTTDQRGVKRPQGVGCDIGAYELLVAPSTPAPVGGIVALPVSVGHSGSTTLPMALLAVGAALTIALSVWYGRRRWRGL